MKRKIANPDFAEVTQPKYNQEQTRGHSAKRRLHRIPVEFYLLDGVG